MGRRRGHGRVREEYKNAHVCLKKKDSDNMLKFVLDCILGIVVHDDSQAVQTVTRKVWDGYGNCEGSTTFIVSVASETAKDEELAANY